MLAFGLAGILGWTGILTSCTSRSLNEETNPLPTAITLDRTTYFVSQTGEDIPVPPGTYEVSSEHGYLQLTGETTDHPLIITAHPTTHEETVTVPTPLSFSEQDDLHVLMLLLPDGKALEATGSYSGIRSRATHVTKKRTGASRATVKQQFDRARLTSRARVTIKAHFTLRVPIQLSHLDPDIDKLKLQCWTHSGNDATKYDRRIGEGESVANIANRQYQGTVVVMFNASQGKEPEDADQYYCGILLHKPGIGFRQPGKHGTPLGNQKPAWLVSADGTPFRIHAQGSVN